MSDKITTPSFGAGFEENLFWDLGDAIDYFRQAHQAMKPGSTGAINCIRVWGWLEELDTIKKTAPLKIEIIRALKKARFQLDGLQETLNSEAAEICVVLREINAVLATREQKEHDDEHP